VIVYLAQCLCPQRHALMAVYGEDEKTLEWRLRQMIERLIDKNAINPWCGICRASVETWYYEVAKTRFATMQEAKPALSRLQSANLEANSLLSDSPVLGKGAQN